jgi:hypothetical protein
MDVDCPRCYLKNYNLVDAQGKAFTHNQISLNSENNIEILTTSAFNQTFYVEGFIDSKTQVECSKVVNSK